MALERLEIQPGIIKSDTPYTMPGRYIDAQWVRFSGGLPEKRGGRQKLNYTIAAMSGVCRGTCQWRDTSNNSRFAFGTTRKLYVYTNGVLTDITPLRGRTTGTITNKIHTTNGSADVTINHTAHHLAQNDWVQLTATSVVDGVAVAGVYLVKSITDADNYVITTAEVATGSTAGGGGAMTLVYYYKILGSAPIASTNGSKDFVITDSAHGAVEGDTIIISGATAVATQTLSGTYLIKSATANTYTVTHTGVANATTTGGGTAVKVVMEISAGLVSSADFHGYGLGTYGSGTYGTPRSGSVRIDLQTWSLDNYGDWLLSSPVGGALYKWDPTNQTNPRAVELYGAPATMNGFFITPERYIIALGTNGNQLEMRWPDQLNPNDWVSTEANTANESRRVQGGSRLITGASIRTGINLIWSDAVAFTHQWRADDYVFTTLGLGNGTGIWGANAKCVAGETGYWIGDGAFWAWDGSLSQLPSDDIRDYFFSTVDRQQRSKCFMGAIGFKNEIIILYQETGQTEINRYLIYNHETKVWTTGAVLGATTVWLDRVLFDNPISVTQTGLILYEEVGTDDYDGAAIDSYIEAGPVDISTGNSNLDIMGFWPDIQEQVGALSLYVQIRAENTQDPVTSSGPHTLAATGGHIDLRESGKLAGFKLESNVVGGYWRIGVCRADVQPAGAR